MQARSVRLMGRSNRSGELLIRLRAGQAVPLQETNPYVRQACEMRDLVLTAPELEAGFPELFPRPADPVWAEVGCYFGETLTAMAGNVSGVNFLGVDIRFKRVVKSGLRIRKAGLQNARVVLCDVDGFLDALPPRSLAGINVFFPDPWPRRKHRKHRFVNHGFLERAASRCRSGGVFWFKTDQESYFREVEALVPQYGFVTDTVPPRILGDRDYDSVFQRLFQRQSDGVYQAAWKRES